MEFCVELLRRAVVWPREGVRGRDGVRRGCLVRDGVRGNGMVGCWGRCTVGVAARVASYGL